MIIDKSLMSATPFLGHSVDSSLPMSPPHFSYNIDRIQMPSLRPNEQPKSTTTYAPRRDRTVPTLESHVPIYTIKMTTTIDRAIFIVPPRTCYSLNACPGLEEQPTVLSARVLLLWSRSGIRWDRVGIEGDPDRRRILFPCSRRDQTDERQ